MTPDDLEQAWPAGLPTSGTIRLNIPEGRRSDPEELFDLVAENIRILAETVTKSFGFIDPAFEFQLSPSEDPVPVWTVDFQNTAPATDALALTLTAFYGLALQDSGELYDTVSVDAPPDVMVPHRRLMALPRYPNMIDEETGAALSPTDLSKKQDWGVVLEFPAKDDDDIEKLDAALFRLSDLVEVGCFDIPGIPPERVDIVEPFVGHIPETNTRTAGLRGFRGEGDLVLWLSAYASFALNRPLADARAVFFPDDR